MKVERGHHFSFTVKNLQKSRAFYGGVLGLQEIDRPNFKSRGTWYRVGETQVHLVESASGADLGSPCPVLTSGASHSAFQIDDYQSALDALRDAGIQTLERGPEAGQIFVRDPDGHVIELIQPGGKLGR